MTDMIRVSVDPSKIGHMVTEGKRVTITQPTYTGPEKITFYVECACGHPMGRKMTAAEAQASMTPDGLIPYDGLCPECAEAVESIKPGDTVRCVDSAGAYNLTLGNLYTVTANADGWPVVVVEGVTHAVCRFRPVNRGPKYKPGHRRAGDGYLSCSDPACCPAPKIPAREVERCPICGYLQSRCICPGGAQ